ncbi:sensor histidine kinase [Thermoproteota archaeon]
MPKKPFPITKETASLEKELEKIKGPAKLKNDFISSLAHELRNPLSTIKESLALVLEGAGGPVTLEQTTILEAAKRGTERLIRLVSNMLDISNIQSGKPRLHPEKVDIAPYIHNLIDQFQGAAKHKGVILNQHISQNVPTIWTDRDKLSQIMVNLVDNAIKFTPQGGFVTIQTKKSKTNLQVNIIDTGIGISQSNIKKIFIKYERFRMEQFEGTGLGLFITKGLIEQLGGTIWVKSKVKEGTIFSFLIPIKAAQISVSNH